MIDKATWESRKHETLENSVGKESLSSFIPHPNPFYIVSRFPIALDKINRRSKIFLKSFFFETM